MSEGSLPVAGRVNFSPYFVKPGTNPPWERKNCQLDPLTLSRANPLITVKGLPEYVAIAAAEVLAETVQAPSFDAFQLEMRTHCFLSG